MFYDLNYVGLLNIRFEYLYRTKHGIPQRRSLNPVLSVEWRQLTCSDSLGGPEIVGRWEVSSESQTHEEFQYYVGVIDVTV